MPPTPDQITIDAGAVVRVLQETHPEAVRMAVWRVRAERAEARVAELEAAVSEPAPEALR